MIKSYKGGYSILDTTPITFEAEDSGVTISDTYILNQLLEILKPHFYNWEKDLKPIYLRYISDVNGVCVALCTLSHVSNDVFLITANLSHDTIEIQVELSEDSDTHEIYISDCVYTYATLTQAVNNEISGGNIEVGTKLYKHVIELQDSVDPNVTHLLNFITNVSTKINAKSDVIDLFNQGTSMVFMNGNENVYGTVAVISDGSLSNLYIEAFSQPDGGFTAFGGEIISDSDVVAPL